MNIYFAGTMQSVFIRQDADLLSENHKLTIFDFSKHAASLLNIHNFLIRAFFEWNNIRNSDVVILWFVDYPALPFIVWGKLFRKPIITHVGGWEVCSIPEIKYGNQLNFIRGSVTRWILRNSNVCIVPSNAYRQITKKCEPKSNIIIIPNWVDSKLCESQLPPKSGVVTALTSIKFAGVLKGIPTFEKATKNINSKIIENISHDELIEILKASKIYCQLSYTESFGVTLLEAMACGCIPIVTDRDALPEVVGDCGYIVPYGDVRKTRRSIQHVLSRSHPDIQSIRNRAKMFNREKTKLLINSLLEKLCNHL